jgi:hypothetical protein
MKDLTVHLVRDLSIVFELGLLVRRVADAI